MSLSQSLGLYTLPVVVDMDMHTWGGGREEKELN